LPSESGFPVFYLPLFIELLLAEGLKGRYLVMFYINGVEFPAFPAFMRAMVA
jgi:hypothetical protein